MQQHTDKAVTEALFSLLKTSLWGADRFPLTLNEETDWSAVYTELRHHAIQNLVVDLLVKADPERKAQYLNSAVKGLSHWYRLMSEQQNLCNLLKEAGILCAVLKGAAADYAYPKHMHRSMGDIDLIVKLQDFDRAYNLLIQHTEYICENYRHVNLRKNGIIIELHRSFSTLNDPKKRALLDSWIADSLSQTVSVTMEQFTFPMLPRLAHGLVLLEHINSHMESGLGLRQIIDWMMFTDKELTDEIWENEFASKVQHLGLDTLTITITRMCQLYLGLRKDLTFCHCADASLCHDLMEHILRQGNFGRKHPIGYNKAISILSTAKKSASLFHILQNYGCINWTATSKYPFLKPFAWLYQICRYIRLGFQRKHPFQYFLDILRNEHSQDVLFDRLGITRIKERK